MKSTMVWCVCMCDVCVYVCVCVCALFLLWNTSEMCVSVTVWVYSRLVAKILLPMQTVPSTMNTISEENLQSKP